MLRRLFSRKELFGGTPKDAVSVHLASGSEAEARTREVLIELLERHDARKWRFTPRVVIQDGVTAHSHPVLTLSSRDRGDPHLVLSTYLHEQLHWFVSRRRGQFLAATNQLKKLFPDPPVEPPRGTGSVDGDYQHYVVCWLEFAALRELLGVDEARRVIDHWRGDHYSAIYDAVVEHYDEIGEIVRLHGLEP